MLSVLDTSKLALACVGDTRAVDEAVCTLRSQLRVLPTSSDEFRGRKCGDTAFNLALAGCDDDLLFTALCDRAEHELIRTSRRNPSKGLNSVAAMAERLAAAGCRSEQAAGAYNAALERLLQAGADDFRDTAAALTDRTLRLHTPRAAVWIHRRHHHHTLSGVQRRPAPTYLHAPDAPARLGTLFDDETRPLSVDIGCGYGVGALGVATAADSTDWNVVGCDLNSAGIAFASGVAARWRLRGRCSFIHADAASVLRRLGGSDGEYAGAVGRVVLSCPTPFQLRVGGSTFPRAPTATLDFFADSALFECCARALQAGGTLHLASNVEDVALTLYDNAMRTGAFDEIVVPLHADRVIPPRERLRRHAVSRPEARSMPQRQRLWRSATSRRAAGPAWESGRLLLDEACSETELAYRLEGRETFRVALVRNEMAV